MSATNPLYDEELHCRHCAYQGTKCKRANNTTVNLVSDCAHLHRGSYQGICSDFAPNPNYPFYFKNWTSFQDYFDHAAPDIPRPNLPTKLLPLFSVSMVIAALFTLSARTILSSATSIRMVSSAPSIARSKPKTFILRLVIPIQPKPVISLLCHKVLPFRRKLSVPSSPPIRL